jgi:hypothetical protein
LHSPVESEPLGAGGLGDHGDDVFIFGLWGVVCVLALPGERRREKRNIRPLVSPGPSTEKSRRRIKNKKAPRFVLSPLVCWVSYFLYLYTKE